MEPEYWKRAIIKLKKEDVILKSVIERNQKNILKSRNDPFGTLLKSIVGQQISVIAADSIHSKLVTKCGEINRQSISALTIEELASCGLTRPKCQYIQGIVTSNIPLLPDNYE